MTEDEGVADAIASLVSEIQVFSARASELSSPHPHHRLTRRDLEGYVIDLAETHARISNMFDYARGASNTIRTELEPDAIVTGVRLVGFLGNDALEDGARIRWNKWACDILLDGRGSAAMLATLACRDPDRAMRRFDVSRQDEHYVRGPYRYDRLEDAMANSVALARRDAR